jgi:hypothetical protein
VVPLIENGGCGNHLEIGFRQITQERFDRLSGFFLWIGLHYRGRVLSKSSATQNPRWLPGGHLSFCIPDFNARTEWQIDLKCFFCGFGFTSGKFKIAARWTLSSDELKVAAPPYNI